MEAVKLTVALLIIGMTVYLMVRRVEVRLVLLGAGLLMATVAGKPLVIADEFTQGMVAALVAPICAAMGFAAVLGATGCDRHLVHVLLAPIRRARWLVVPGGILAAYVVNLAVPSQTSTAAALGPVLVPLLLAAGIRPEVAGAALVLGASFGGDLLSPGAGDIQAVAEAAKLSAQAISARIIPASIAGVLVAATVFALLNRPRKGGTTTDSHASTTAPLPTAGDRQPAIQHPTTATSVPQPPVAAPPAPLVRAHPIKALLPLLPVGLLLVAQTGWEPLSWLVSPREGDPVEKVLPVVRAMLVGTLLAALVSWREIQEVTRSLFEGMGFAYANIISLTITAKCFGAGIAAIGVSEALLRLLGGLTWALAALAAAFPWALAMLSGSGSGPVQTFAQTFLAHVGARHDAATLGALACLGGAFGRTMSPVAAVVVYSSALVGVAPLRLVRRLLPALLAGALVSLTLVLLAG